MSGEVVNLRRLRKAKTRAEKADKAALNRLYFGKSKTERAQDAALEAVAQKRLDAHRLEPAAADGDPGQPHGTQRPLADAADDA